ncbi:hypothetical protein NDU88_003379 [Pleurodeles waltl]|uniref:Uncharacterized protein n=1 Tax=Pleurodeles waltl TaxID=8319 RepID=A0AAV7TNJ2_PLEWA|nr:hypothetical protein NDU88_003379 [Pleurodeles waltl]
MVMDGDGNLRIMMDGSGVDTDASHLSPPVSTMRVFADCTVKNAICILHPGYRENELSGFVGAIERRLGKHDVRSRQ